MDGGAIWRKDEFGDLVAAKREVDQKVIGTWVEKVLMKFPIDSLLEQVKDLSLHNDPTSQYRCHIDEPPLGRTMSNRR